MRIVFMGTPDFSVSALDTLYQAGHEIVAVYSQPPRRAGRGKKERPSPVHARAEQLGLEVRNPVNFKDPNDVADFKDLNADVAVVVAYGLLLPQSILDVPKRGCLNIHASLLPRWRGAAPIHRAIMAGDQKTGVCIMQMEIGLDTGPVLMRDETNISIEDTTLSLHDRLAKIGADLIAKTLDGLDNLKAVSQPEEGVTYAKKIDKTEAKINWNDTAQSIDRKIRGLSPFPGAWFDIREDRIKVLMSKIAEGEGTPGQVLDDEITVSCGSGAIKLITLQRAGKGPMKTQDFLRGFAINKGDTL